MLCIAPSVNLTRPKHFFLHMTRRWKLLVSEILLNTSTQLKWHPVLAIMEIVAGQCTLQMDDYFECLHHTKEKARAKAIKDQELKLIEEKKKQDELSRKLTDSANKSNVTRLGIIEDNVKQKEVSN
ncbi:NADH dehydrogenase (ubiquinone) Fe-S protein 5 [Rhizophagus clarus]|uniref:NADH dehydrogenase (Ubiquinone) Fe-S protein 5 n=1 Tax=Rhizophagus clarus TaxID=94130 RepID=A0A8H3L0K4_9GLOM|nr:NADH dehydrogenase (ubiquinone) Fe-S protein 5 [Rhizophagus clarus]